MPRGEASEEDAAEKRCAQSEQQDLDIEVRIGFVGDAELISGHEAHHAAEESDGEEGSKKAAHQSQGEAFDQELAEDAGARGPLRGAYGDFFLAGGAPG